MDSILPSGQPPKFLTTVPRSGPHLGTQYHVMSPLFSITVIIFWCMEPCMLHVNVGRSS